MLTLRENLGRPLRYTLEAYKENASATEVTEAILI